MERAALVAAIALAAAWLLLHRRRRLPLWRRLAQRADRTLPTHLISLARLPAKRTSVLQRAAEAGLTDVSVFDAVDGRELSPEELQRRGVSTYAGWRLPGSSFRFFDRELKWGEVGCALSHVGVWRRVEASSAPAAVVIEDDVVFAPGFAALLRAALDEVTALLSTPQARQTAAARP